MNTTLPFVKYSGNGNDFVILYNPNFKLSTEQIQRLCDRHFGIGSDGVLILSETQGFDGEMRIFNADGGEAEMCGNGIRCVATYLDDMALKKKDAYKIKTMNGSYTVYRRSGSFAIEMSEIKDKNKFDLSCFHEFDRSFFINTGVPHLVFLTKDVKSYDIKSVAPKYRHHQMFPGGTNVSLVEVTGEKEAYVRTFERGVEDETFSCGTGLTATALALTDWLGWEGDITLLTLGGKQNVNVGNQVFYSGEVTRCFSGHVEV